MNFRRSAVAAMTIAALTLGMSGCGTIKELLTDPTPNLNCIPPAVQVQVKMYEYRCEVVRYDPSVNVTEFVVDGPNHWKMTYDLVDNIKDTAPGNEKYDQLLVMQAVLGKNDVVSYALMSYTVDGNTTTVNGATEEGGFWKYDNIEADKHSSIVLVVATRAAVDTIKTSLDADGFLLNPLPSGTIVLPNTGKPTTLPA